MFGRIRCASVCYVPYGDLANHTLLSHRRHPALFARFDEANSRFAFAFAFRTGCAHDSSLSFPLFPTLPLSLHSLGIYLCEHADSRPRARGVRATSHLSLSLALCAIVSEIRNSRETPRHRVTRFPFTLPASAGTK